MIRLRVKGVATGVTTTASSSRGKKKKVLRKANTVGGDQQGFDFEHHPFFVMLKERFPEKLARAESQRHCICLPEVGSIRSDCDLGEDLFDAHILQQQPEEEDHNEEQQERQHAWYRSRSRRGSLIVESEKEGRRLKLLSAPGYQPSFKKGLHKARVLQTAFGVNKDFQKFTMYALDRPLLPKYTRAKLTAEDTMSVYSRSSSGFSSAGAPSTSSTRISSAAHNRPYSTVERRGSMSSIHCTAVTMSRPGSSNMGSVGSRGSHGRRSSSQGPGSKRASGMRKSMSMASRSPPRQWSADSGIEADNGLDRRADRKFVLPPRITSYPESESYLMSLPRCDQFVTHLARMLRPIMTDLRFTQSQAKQQLKAFAPKLHRLAQESTIAFPRSASLVSNSPRFQEFLRLAVENVVMRFVHDRLFPLICHLSSAEDRQLSSSANYLHAVRFSADQLGLPEDFCVPLPAAIVELSSLDMRTTPLDRLTCIYDTVQQIRTHLREAVLEARADSDHVEVPEDLPTPSEGDLVLLLANVIVQARPLHLMSTLNYADLFAWTVPIDMIEVVKLISSACDFVKNVQPKKLLPSTGKLKREVSMEEIIQLTDDLSRSFDRRGNRREPLKSALDLHRERFAQRLEQSTEERTKRQDEAWARLDRCPDPPPSIERNRFKRGILSSIHHKMMCSSDPLEVVEPNKSFTKETVGIKVNGFASNGMDTK